jgi:hypothetical protein
MYEDIIAKNLLEEKTCDNCHWCTIKDAEWRERRDVNTCEHYWEEHVGRRHNLGVL